MVANAKIEYAPAPLYSIRNVGGYCPEHGVGELNSALPPLWCVDFFRPDGRHLLTSVTYDTWQQAMNRALEGTGVYQGA